MNGLVFKDKVEAKARWGESNRTLTNNFDAHWGNATHMKRQESKNTEKLKNGKNTFTKILLVDRTILDYKTVIQLLSLIEIIIIMSYFR
jgi:hypothetical protein